MFLAASMRSGVKSLASILVETSRASTISIPSVSVLLTLEDVLGLAMARMSRATAIILRTAGRWRSTPANPVPVLPKGAAVDIATYGRRRRTCFQTYHAAIGTSRNSNHRTHVYSKYILFIVLPSFLLALAGR